MTGNQTVEDALAAVNISISESHHEPEPQKDSGVAAIVVVNDQRFKLVAVSFFWLYHQETKDKMLRVCYKLHYMI